MNDVTHAVWSERYRPRTIDDCILPAELKATFQKFVDDAAVDVNLLLVGPSGLGKTTVARAMLEQIDADYMVINASLHGNIDMLRTTIQQFASTVSFKSGRKYVILDEADYLTHLTQPALRNFMDEFSSNCGFILTANYQSKIIEPLQGRCSVIEFKLPASEAPALAMAFMKRVETILEQQGVTYERAVVAQMIRRWFPNMRRIINELQRASKAGPIDSGVLAVRDADWTGLWAAMKGRDFGSVRKWVAVNSDLESALVFRRLYDELAPQLAPQAVPALIIILADYQAKAAIVADQEINLAAAIAEAMANCDFK